MTPSVRLAPNYSLVIVEDADGGVPPDTLADGVISATSSCVAVGCKSEADGETEISLGNAEEFEGSVMPAFEGVVLTPTRRLVVRGVDGSTILETRVPSPQTRIKIWINDAMEPDVIMIGITE